MIDYEFNRPAPLMTWLDVERRFRELRCREHEFLDSIVTIDCYSEGTEITLDSDKSADQLHGWLKIGFGDALDENDNRLTLSIDKVKYPIEILPPEKKRNLPVAYPLWRDLAYGSTGFLMPESFPENLYIGAFHSFKGGVGRTTALITYLAAYLEQNKKRKAKILLIDADLEAPGITYWLDNANRPSISFVRFLEAVHYPPSSVAASIRYCAAELRKTSVTLNGNQEVFVLPACVNPKQPIELLDTPVLPEHIARNTENPWGVGDFIQQLATELKADCVLIDLRAGLSELASPLLFDPRIERFVVSTIAPQSVNGAVLVLEKMAALRFLASDSNSQAAVPTVILSLLTPQLRESTDYDTAVAQMYTAFPPDSNNDTATIDIIEANFDNNLMCLRDLTQALALSRNSPLFGQFKVLLSTPNGAKKTIKTSKRTAEAKRLGELCEQYVYAESGQGRNLLITEPLRNLAKHYQNSIPITLSIGAKGAGKTFNFLQLSRAQTWEGFLEKLNVPAIDNNETLIFPFLASKNLGDSAKEIIRRCRKNCYQKLRLDCEFSDIDLQDRIKNEFSANQNDWVTFWTNEILRTFNIS
ncbi:MAG: KGGVGR-motif variant AAA ATPase, partial [Methylococcales bacterium]